MSNSAVPVAVESEALFSQLRELPDFQAIAYYDKHMDCIRVQLCDCSVMERRVNKHFTILKANGEIKTGETVGLNIKGVRYLFRKIGLPDNGVVKLTELIDSIAKMFPESTIEQVRKEIDPIIGSIDDVEVDVHAVPA